MATAMVMQMRRNVGFMFRESGQAMERLGMSMMGDYSYMEPRECRVLFSPQRFHPHAHFGWAPLPRRRWRRAQAAAAASPRGGTRLAHRTVDGLETGGVGAAGWVARGGRDAGWAVAAGGAQGRRNATLAPAPRHSMSARLGRRCGGRFQRVVSGCCGGGGRHGGTESWEGCAMRLAAARPPASRRNQAGAPWWLTSRLPAVRVQ